MGVLKPWLFHVWHYDIDENRKGAEHYRLRPPFPGAAALAARLAVHKRGGWVKPSMRD